MLVYSAKLLRHKYNTFFILVSIIWPLNNKIKILNEFDISEEISWVKLQFNYYREFRNAL